MTLYEMTEAARSLYAMLESGDIDEQTYRDTLESIGTEEKIDSYCAIIRQFTADIEAIKAEKDRLDALKKTAENALERMKGALKDYVYYNGGKAKTAKFSVSLKTTQASEITDETLIPSEYWKPQPDKLMRSEILADLKSGKEIAGARIKESVSVVIK